MRMVTGVSLQAAASQLLRSVVTCSASVRLSGSLAQTPLPGAAAPAGSKTAFGSSGTAHGRLAQRRALQPLVAFALPAWQFSPPWAKSSSGSAGALKSSPWLQLLRSSQPQQEEQPKQAVQQPDPATGLIDWSPSVVSVLDRFWSRERGVSEVTQRRRHVAHAELDPKQRDLGYVRDRMASWDAAASDFEGVDVNRVVRNGIDIMEREPDVWRARILILAAAYPDVNWPQFFAEYPSLCYVPNATLSRAVNDWADQLACSYPCGWEL